MTAAEVLAQLVIAGTGIAALALVILDLPPRWKRWAPVVGLAGQPFWLHSAWTKGQFGILILSIAYTVLWLVAGWKELKR